MKVQLKDLINNLKEKEEALSKSEETLEIVKKRMLKEKNEKYENKITKRYNDLKFHRLESTKKDMDEFQKSNKEDETYKSIMVIRFLEDIINDILKEEKYLEFSKKILNIFEKSILSITENKFRTEEILKLEKEELKKIQNLNESNSKIKMRKYDSSEYYLSSTMREKSNKLEKEELKEIESNIKELSLSLKDYSENFQNQFFEYLINEKDELYKSLNEISDYTYKSLITSENNIKLPFSFVTKIKNWYEETFKNENKKHTVITKIMRLEKEYESYLNKNIEKFKHKDNNSFFNNEKNVKIEIDNLMNDSQIFYKSMLWLALNHQTFSHNHNVIKKQEKNFIEFKEKYSKTKQNKIEINEDIESNESDLQKEYKKQKEIEKIESEIREYQKKLSYKYYVEHLLSDLKDEVKNEFINDKELLNDAEEINKITKKQKKFKTIKNNLTNKISILESKVRTYGNKYIEINNNFNNYYNMDYNRQITDNSNDIVMLMLLLDSYDNDNSEHLKYIDKGIDSNFSSSSSRSSYDDNTNFNNHSSKNDWNSSSSFDSGGSSYSSDSDSSYSSYNSD